MEPREFRFGDWVYSGLHGFGVIPDFRRDKPTHYIQRCLFDIFDRSEALPKARESPLKKKRRVKRRKLQHQTLLPFIAEESEARKLITAPVPGLSDLRERPAFSPKEDETLPDGRVVRIPANLEELITRYGLKHVNRDVLLYVSEQARGVMLAGEIEENILFIAPTGFGKTLLELLIADRAISSGGKVLLFTPLEDLVDQLGKDAVQDAADEARCFFLYSEEMICMLSGAVNPKERQELYADSAKKLFITTPETFVNDVRSGKLDPGIFSLALFDEAHRAVGEYAYVQAASELRTRGVRLRAFSATVPDRVEKLAQCLEALAIKEENIHRLRDESKKLKFEGTVYTPADPQTVEIADLLFSAASQAAYSLRENLGAAMGTPQGIILEAEQAYRIFSKATYTDRDSFRLPTFQSHQSIGIRLRKLIGGDSRRFAKCYSKWCEFGELVHLYHLFTCYGKYTFVHSLAEIFWGLAKLPGGKAEDRTFMKMIGRNRLILQAYNLLAKDSVLELVQPNTPSLYRLRRALCGEDRKRERELQDQPEEVRRMLFERGMAQFVARETIDSPSEAKCLMLVERHATFGNHEQIQIYSNNAIHATFVAARIDRHLAHLEHRALPYAGIQRMRRKVRRENLQKFRDGAVSTLVGTSAIREGLHTKCNVLIVNSPVCVAGDLEQLRGRPGRGDKPAIIYYLVTPNTLEEIWFWAGWRRHGKFKRYLHGKD